MSESLTEFGKLFSLVCIDFILGVGLGVSMANPGYQLDSTIAVASGGIVCITVAALIQKIVVEQQPR